MPYASPADLAAFIQSAVDTATADLMLSLASSAVDTVVGHSLTEAPYSDVLDGRESDVIWPVAAGWAFTGETITEDGTALSPDDYVKRADGGVERVGGKWGRLVELSYTTGFAADSMELATAKRITLEAASRALANPQDLDSLGGEGLPSMNFRRGAGPVSLSREHKADLAPFKWRRRWA